MRIFTDNQPTETKNLTLVLTKGEIREFIGYLEQLLEGEHHCHLPDIEYVREITMCMYDPSRTEEYDPQIQSAFKSIDSIGSLAQTQTSENDDWESPTLNS